MAISNFIIDKSHGYVSYGDTYRSPYLQYKILEHGLSAYKVIIDTRTNLEMNPLLTVGRNTVDVFYENWLETNGKHCLVLLNGGIDGIECGSVAFDGNTYYFTGANYYSYACQGTTDKYVPMGGVTHAVIDEFILTTNLPIFANSDDAVAWARGGCIDNSKILNVLEPSDADSLLLRRNMIPNWTWDVYNSYGIMYSCDVNDLLWNRYWGRGISRNTDEPVIFCREFNVDHRYYGYAVITRYDSFTYDHYKNEAHTNTFNTGLSGLTNITAGSPFLTPLGHEFHLYVMTYAVDQGEIYGATKTMGASRNVPSGNYGQYQMYNKITEVYSTNITFDHGLLVAIDWLLF